MPRLIVNADDLGYTPGIEQAVLELHAVGALRSATLMASGAAFDAAARTAQATPTLGVGCHISLVDGVPLLPPGQVGTLLEPAHVSATPRFRSSLARFARDLTLGRIDSREIEAEAAAQIARLQQTGVRVTHLDTHKHTHIFPRVLRPLLRAALSRGVRAIRNPFEPTWARRATPGAPVTRRLEVRALSIFRGEFLRAVAASGLRSTDGALGVLATGTLDAPTLRALLAAIPPGNGTWELVCHPGYPDAALAALPTRLQAQRGVERAALAEVLPASGIEQCHFGHL